MDNVKLSFANRASQLIDTGLLTFAMNLQNICAYTNWIRTEHRYLSINHAYCKYFWNCVVAFLDLESLIRR